MKSCHQQWFLLCFLFQLLAFGITFSLAFSPTASTTSTCTQTVLATTDKYNKQQQQQCRNPRSSGYKLTHKNFQPLTTTSTWLVLLAATTSVQEEEEEAQGDDNNGNNNNKKLLPATKSTTATIRRQRQRQEYHYRSIQRMEKYARLPVWPVWSGVLLFLAEKVFGNSIAAALENIWTGRVCPQIFVHAATSTAFQETSPFVLMVHHVHSFAMGDAIRWFQKFAILPEGFPAHPHRGFVTYTYFLQGGFVHRDSMGIRQVYGRSTRQKSTSLPLKEQQQQPPHSQWLQTGAGLLHEEMFHQESAWWPPQRQELYQIWINVPRKFKMNMPSTMLLRDEEAVNGDCTRTSVGSGMGGSNSSSKSPRSHRDSNIESLSSSSSSPTLPTQTMGTTPVYKTRDMTVRVLAGRYMGLQASVPPPELTANDDDGDGLQLTMLHVTLHPHEEEYQASSKSSSSRNNDNDNDNGWMRIDLPASFETAIVYVRQGQLECRQEGDETAILPVHHTVFFSTSQGAVKEDTTLMLRATHHNAAPSFLMGGRRVVMADFMLLAAVPIRGEACQVGGSMVMTNAWEIDLAYRDYQAGVMGRPWDHALSDEAWQAHVQENPNAAYYSTTTTTTTADSRRTQRRQDDDS